ncbi:MAG TPA: hypothetical protein VMS21_16240, partial [Methylomirabilota bacterium]|nr:hypothetical protein [Methylomirabilota bacterium]
MKPNVLAWIACVTLCTSTASAAVITVNSADNTLINPNDTLTNLVEALTLAQDGDQIHFNIPGPGPHYLETPAGGYPPITANNLTLDGYTQPGAVPNTNPILAANSAELRIVLDSRNGGRTVQDIDGYGTSESAILFVTGATNVQIRGFSFLGVVAAGSDADPAMYCVSFGLKATDGHVHGCWMGVDPDGVTVHGANDGVTGFRFRDNGVPFLSDRITVGVAKDATNPRAQFNVIVGMTIPVIIEGAGTRISGNFLSVMPDGVTDYNVTLIHGQGFEGQIEIGRDGANTVIGTDGDGVNDADERNIMGGVIPRSYNPQGYDTVIEFYGGNNRTNVVIAGNYIGVGVDGETWFTNSARI